MDTGFEILLSFEEELTSLNFKRQTYELDGVYYPQSNEEAYFHPFKLLKSDVPLHVISMLPSNMQKVKWQCISIIGNGLDLVKANLEVNSSMNVDALYSLLCTLLKDKAQWVVVFEPDYDRIDEVLSGSMDEVFAMIKASLVVDKKGFIVWHDE
ncbi:MAG TPA: hypothetical protein VL947_12080 [Cytophagales bacterium]|nr:hypothetical protein [Cytophagales bacterium]